MTYYIANWKQNLTLQEAQNWLTHFPGQTTEKKKIIIAGSFLHLPILTGQQNIIPAIQDISPYENGPHTGQIGVQQVKDLAQFCLVGHSESRKELGITDSEVAQKVRLLLKVNITPIVCLDQPYLESQIRTLQLELLELKDLIFAYEPASAIGSSQPETPARANEIAFKILNLSHNRSLPILYGGSVDHLNIADFLTQEFLSGVLIGSASLDPGEFAKITEQG